MNRNVLCLFYIKRRECRSDLPSCSRVVIVCELGMHFLQLFLFSFLWTLPLYATDDGLTTDVTWDQYSLMVNGERVFIFSGEFHYERMPVPELWLDIFQKFKANGLNAVRYFFSLTSIAW